MEQIKIKNPFELFPIEVWEIMLDQMEDSKNILTVLRGIPKLDISISYLKRLWLIDQVLPFLYNLIDQKDVLNLRLVCKQWQSRVDYFLPNQPYFRAYSEELYKDHPNVWGHLNDFEENQFDQSSDQIQMYANTDNGSGTKLLGIIQHSQHKNPFVFRLLSLDITGSDINDPNGKNSPVEKWFSILEQIGTHLWYLHIKIATPVYTQDVLDFVRILNLTPNLKWMWVNLFKDFARPTYTPQSDLELLTMTLPELPLFEGIEVSGEQDDFSSEEFVRIFINRYGPQIRRLELVDHNWKVTEMKLFPQVTELRLCLIAASSDNYYPDEITIQTLKSLIFSISSKSLARLQLSFHNLNSAKDLIIIEEDILNWLKRFPCLKYFGITDSQTDDLTLNINQKESLVLIEKGAADPIIDRIPSLETLKVTNFHGLSYNFLPCFLSLRHLEIQPFSCPTVVDYSTPSPFNLREHIQTGKLYESNIWEVLPKLEKISLEVSDYSPNHRFSRFFYRSIYDKIKEVGQVPVEHRLLPFREDIQYFLNHDEEEIQNDRNDANEEQIE